MELTKKDKVLVSIAIMLCVGLIALSCILPFVLPVSGTANAFAPTDNLHSSYSSSLSIDWSSLPNSSSVSNPVLYTNLASRPLNYSTFSALDSALDSCCQDLIDFTTNPGNEKYDPPILYTLPNVGYNFYPLFSQYSYFATRLSESSLTFPLVNFCYGFTVLGPYTVSTTQPYEYYLAFTALPFFRVKSSSAYRVTFTYSYNYFVYGLNFSNKTMTFINDLPTYRVFATNYRAISSFSSFMKVFPASTTFDFGQGITLNTNAGLSFVCNATNVSSTGYVFEVPFASFSNTSYPGSLFYLSNLFNVQNVFPDFRLSSLDTIYANGLYSDGVQAGYQSGYRDGLSQGNLNGYESGYNTGQSEGMQEGLEAGRLEGYNSGYSAGVASASDYSFLSLMGSVVDAPLNAFTSLLNFEILGTNLSSFVLGLTIIALGIVILKKVL